MKYDLERERATISEVLPDIERRYIRAKESVRQIIEDYVFGGGRAVNTHGYELYGGTGRMLQLIDHVWCSTHGAFEKSVEWADISNRRQDLISSLCDSNGTFRRTPEVLALDVMFETAAAGKMLFTESVHIYSDILGDTCAVVLNHIFGAQEMVRVATLDHLQGREFVVFCQEYGLCGGDEVSLAAKRIDMQYRNKVLVHNRFSKLHVTPQGVSEPCLSVMAFGDRLNSYDQHLMGYEQKETSVTKVAPEVFDLVCAVVDTILKNRNRGIPLLR